MLARMLALILLALSVGIVDSLNPSTLGPALYLATGKNPVRSLALFTLGAFGVYLTGGILIALGPGEALLALLPHPGHHVLHLLEICGGVVVLVVAAVLWFTRGSIGKKLGRPKSESKGGHGPLLLGAGIMLVELPTAFPYFAVIAAVVASGQNVANQLLVIVIFNLAFIAPLLAIIGLCAFAHERSAPTLEVWRVTINRLAPIVLPAVIAVAGLALIAVGVVGLT